LAIGEVDDRETIDADLHAGAIDQAEARRRRRELEREPQMHASPRRDAGQADVAREESP
jgi:hypothetical protein